MVLDAASLEAITQEIRTCFLYEDAPDHLSILEQGIRQLRSSDRSSDQKAEYAALMRAAHSLKGGAGIAQLSTLSHLAHNLEDLIQALEQGRVQEQEAAYELLSVSVEQISSIIAEATSGKEGAFAVVAEEITLLPIITALENFVQGLPKKTKSSDFETQGEICDPYFLKTALEVDLEDCLQRVERLLHSPEKTPSVQPADLLAALTALVEECKLLGQALNLAWLSETANLVAKALAQANPALERIAGTAIKKIRQLRSQLFTQASPSPYPSTGAIPASQGIRSLNLRIPVSRLDRMNNTIGELFISYERLSLYQEQLHQVDLTLKKRAAQLNPIGEQVQAFYDRLATPFEERGSRGMPVYLPDRVEGEEFDPLEFDQYSELHSTLQDFQELMVQVQEARADVQLITHEFREALVQLRQQLDDLRGDLTESRLVRFGLLAKQLVAAQQTFSQRYKKSVELVIIGKDTLIDRVILEQLKIPLIHLFRNAFDHGIETPESRLALGKSSIAQIMLAAAVQGNQIVITISDDGRGIDIQKVYQRSVEMGFCGLESDELSKEKILELLFTPGFSTASTVTALSGRGVGLDIVRLQVERLRGSVRVESSLGQGTKFTISIPLTLSILPLLLCRCQQHTLAIPSNKVIEIIALSEFCDSIPQGNTITWRDRTVPLYPLMQLLPYQQQAIVPPTPQFNQRLGIVVEVDSQLVAIAVDSLIAERELVLKPFDPTVRVPAYVLGCTVLGTGEVVPVLSLDHFGELIARASYPSPHPFSHPLTSKILIVDDAIAFRKLLDRVLSQSGYQVVQCRDGDEALKKLNQPGELFDLVISDIEMPRLDGFALLKEIRSHPRWHSLAVVMLTSRENQRHRQKAMNLGATAYFTKPFRPNELLSAIAALLV